MALQVERELSRAKERAGHEERSKFEYMEERLAAKDEQLHTLRKERNSLMSMVRRIESESTNKSSRSAVPHSSEGIVAMDDDLSSQYSTQGKGGVSSQSSKKGKALDKVSNRVRPIDVHTPKPMSPAVEAEQLSSLLQQLKNIRSDSSPPPLDLSGPLRGTDSAACSSSHHCCEIDLVLLSQGQTIIGCKVSHRCHRIF